MHTSGNRRLQEHRFNLVIQEDHLIILQAHVPSCLILSRSIIHNAKNASQWNPQSCSIPISETKTFPSLHGRTLEFDAIYGIVWLLRGPYLALVSESSILPASDIMEKEIRHVHQLELLLIATYPRMEALTEEQEQAEARYLHMFTSRIKNLELHFAFDTDLTHSLQRISEFSSSASDSAEIAKRADSRFCWNYVHCSLFFESKIYGWITPIMQGFLRATTNIRVNQSDFRIIFISRRSCRRAGTRFTMRGIDEEGNVANFVETEQICAFSDGRRTSFVQVRGSIPLHWSSPVNMKYAPIVYQRNRLEKDIEAFRKHAYELMKLYGRVILINLIDKKRHELSLGNTLAKVIGTAAMQDSRILANIRLVWFDFHQECRNMRYENMDKLIQQVDDDFQNYGYFSQNADGSVEHKQSGIVRTNCMDNLDRTNVVQSLFGRRNLLLQLNEMDALRGNVLQSPYPQLEVVFKNVWGDHADAISLLYAGTGALKTDFTRTGQRTKRGAIMDAYNSCMRYIVNNFMDGHRQDILDLVLGKHIVSHTFPTVSDRESVESLLKKLLLLFSIVFVLDSLISFTTASTLFERIGRAILYTFLLCGVFLFVLIKKGNSYGQRLVRLPSLRPHDGCMTTWKH